MKKLLGKITNMIRRATVSRSLPDTGNYPIEQISYLGKTANAEIIWPYGMGGRLPADAQVFCLNVKGLEENKAGIGTTPTRRFKVPEEGETWFGNPLTGSVTYFRSNGDIETIGKNGESITISGNSDKTIGGDMDLAVTGNVNITVNGNASIAATGTAGLLGSAVDLADLSGRLLMTDDIIAIFNAHRHDKTSGPTNGVSTTTYSAANATSKTKAS